MVVAENLFSLICFPDLTHASFLFFHFSRTELFLTRLFLSPRLCSNIYMAVLTQNVAHKVNLTKIQRKHF